MAMKKQSIHFYTLSLLLIATIFISCKKEQTVDYTAFVDAFIGTGGHGHTFPGAVAPNGMVQLSPDTRRYEWDACAGYHYTDTLINGFSHTHLSGTGIGDYGDILVMPIVGDLSLGSDDKDNQNTTYASTFDKKNEIALPGYYSVLLDDYQVKAELTATQRVGFHRYTFPKSSKGGLLIDLDYAIYPQKTEDLILEVVSPTEIRGYKKTKHWAPVQEIFFYAISSKPFSKVSFYKNDTLLAGQLTKIQGKTGKVFVEFETKEREEVLLKVGLSAVDARGAKNNLLTEIPDWRFDDVRIATRKDWQHFLSKIDVETSNDSLKTIFYTSLYHTAIAPNVFSDIDGRYRGMDRKIHQSKENIYTVFSTWDTMRAFHPLLTIIAPELNEAFIRSLLTKHREGGILPMWELSGNYTATMIGYNAVPIIADAYIKGHQNYDTDLAYEAMIRASVYDTTGIIVYSDAFRDGLVPLSKKYKNEIGYIPCDREFESVAKGLEYAYQDWCIMQVAKLRNDTLNIQKYGILSENYKHYFDASTGFMRGKYADGTWRTPFNPRSSTHRADDYCEGTAWQWLWFVPHQPDSLVALLGGKDAFVKKLDALFTADSSIEGTQTSVDITGLIGQYAHGNEPSHHITHLYNYVGQPYKTQALVDSVLYSQYTAQPNGLAGNEDCGQMSAWYVLNAMGFYQVAPANPIYSIGRPLFDKSTIRLADNRTFEIIVDNNSRKNKYIQSISLNGKNLDKPFFTHTDLMKGGKLHIVMGDKKRE